MPHPARDGGGAMIATAGMTFTSKPPDGPARRAWTILTVVLGEVLQLRFLQEHQGDPAGFWRVRFLDRHTGQVQVKIIPAKNLDAVSDDQIAAIRKLTKKGRDALRRAEAIEQKVIRMKSPGSPTARAVCDDATQGRCFDPRSANEPT